MAAARTVSRIATYGEPFEPKPGLVAKFMIKTVQDDGQVSGNGLPFSFRGTLATTYHAPVEADYIFQFRMLNRRGRAPGIGRSGSLTGAALEAQRKASRRATPPVEFRIDVDGKNVYQGSVGGEEAFNYTRGPTTAKVHLTAGDHDVHVYVPDHAIRLPHRQRPALQCFGDHWGPLTVTSPASGIGLVQLAPADTSGLASRQVQLCFDLEIEGTRALYTMANSRLAVEPDVTAE